MLKKSIYSTLVLVLFAGIGLVIWDNRFNIHDYLVLSNYSPPTAISQLASNDFMTNQGKRLFYINNPQISDRATFNSQCKTTEQTIVLGCYTGNRIYIFKVDDKTLNGIEQVTAAHEMLHAAYSRLSSSERSKIDAMVNAAYKKLNDPRINSLVASYQKQEPNSIPDELHSILGTEVSNVGSDLEHYYARYFTDRSKVVSYAQNYQKVFDDLKNQADQYKNDLDTKATDIEQRKAALDTKSRQLSAQKASMDNLVASGQIQAYNAQVTQYNSAVNAYNDALAAVNQLVSRYNDELQKYNQLVVVQNNLVKEIDSKQSTIPNQ